MKQATIQITFEEEKLRALRRYIAKRDSTLEAELQKAAQRLYEKVVPCRCAGIHQRLYAGRSSAQTAKEIGGAGMSTAGFHITEDCAEVYLQNESGMEFLQLARRLHDYLQQGQRLPARSLFEATDDCKEISREAFDALAKHRMENTGEVSGLFELDFDARTLSALNIMDGWKVYAMQDMADAAEQAYQEAEMSEDDRWRIFLDRLDGQELTTPSRLTARNFYFEDSIEAMDDRILNFYVVPCFNVDEVFARFVETDENDHALNIYANYDMQRQQVCDELEITLYGSGIEDQSLTYHLNAAEKEVLREKMEAYCMQREHKPLKSALSGDSAGAGCAHAGDAAVTGSAFRAVAPVSAVCAAFRRAAERVPAKYPKTGRCAGVRECCKHEKGDQNVYGILL